MPISRSALTSDDALSMVLADLLSNGYETTVFDPLSIGSQRKTKELTNYFLSIDNPRGRLVWDTARYLRLPLAVARFVWMMAGSDRLSEIAFYDERVRLFSDDGVSVPGSNFGQRIIRPLPGINQLSSTIDLLRRDPGTRRAVIAIYQPADCARESRDIPCALSLAFHIRDGRLHPTTVMRSNNAFGLMPYNLFEFSLLAEVVSAELGVPLGPLSHIVLSMHLYAEDFKAAEEISIKDPFLNAPLFPEMPSDPRPLQQVLALIGLESDLRNGQVLRSAESVSWVGRARHLLHPYWYQFFLILLSWASTKSNRQDIASLARESLTGPWSHYLSSYPGASE
jgi:thymidylate synthase